MYTRCVLYQFALARSHPQPTSISLWFCACAPCVDSSLDTKAANAGRCPRRPPWRGGQARRRVMGESRTSGGAHSMAEPTDELTACLYTTSSRHQPPFLLLLVQLLRQLRRSTSERDTCGSSTTRSRVPAEGGTYALRVLLALQPSPPTPPPFHSARHAPYASSLSTPDGRQSLFGANAERARLSRILLRPCLSFLRAGSDRRGFWSCC